jgi:uncharacterized protein
MTNPATRCPFIADKMLTDSQFFVGRQAEIKFVMGMMTNVQPTSVNIVGDRRIGKSSLLYRICQNYKNLVVSCNRQHTEFIVIYLSLADARCKGIDKFYQAIADRLLARSSVRADPDLADLLRVQPLDGTAFNRAMESWKNKGVLPVICLDDFEILLNNVQLFNDSFYDNLRFLIDSKLLMLVIASRTKIEDYRRQYKLTSSFFNLTQQLELKVFSDLEASDLVRLPHGNPALSDPRQKIALNWGEKHPYLLQSAGKYMWEAQQQGHSESWAEDNFKMEVKKVQKPKNILKWGIGAVEGLGKFAKRIGGGVSGAGDLVTGIMIIVVSVALIGGVVKISDISGFCKNILNNTIFQNTETQNNGK